MSGRWKNRRHGNPARRFGGPHSGAPGVEMGDEHQAAAMVQPPERPSGIAGVPQADEHHGQEQRQGRSAPAAENGEIDVVADEARQADVPGPPEFGQIAAKQRIGKVFHEPQAE